MTKDPRVTELEVALESALEIVEHAAWCEFERISDAARHGRISHGPAEGDCTCDVARLRAVLNQEPGERWISRFSRAVAQLERAIGVAEDGDPVAEAAAEVRRLVEEFP